MNEKEQWKDSVNMYMEARLDTLEELYKLSKPEQIPPEYQGSAMMTNPLIVHGKYTLPNQTVTFAEDVRDFITPSDKTVIEAAKKLLKGESPKNLDEMAYAVFKNFCPTKIYAYDSDNFSNLEFWLFPTQALQMDSFDCDEGGNTLTSLLLAVGIPHSRVLTVLGTWNGMGHVWTVYKTEDGHWVVFETTKTKAPEWGELPVMGIADTYKPWYLYNDVYTLKME